MKNGTSLKNRSFLVIYLVFIPIIKTFSQDLWTLETADNLDKLNFRIGAFQSSRVGLTKHIEISSNLLNNIFSPNLGFKFQWWNRQVIIATHHSLNYPKFGLNALKNTNFRKWIGDTTIIPLTLPVKNELLISRYFKKCECCANVYLVTFKAGMVMNSIINNTIFPAIKQPLLYHRTDIYNNKHLWYGGINIQGPIIEKFDFFTDFCFFKIFKGNVETIEHKTMVCWKYNKKFEFFGGYKIAYCDNYEGSNFLFFPLLDAIYKFNIIPKPKNGLFKGRINKRLPKENTFVQ